MAAPSASSIPATEFEPAGSSSSSAIAGCWAVVLLLGGTRWGSYLGANPIFLTDILLIFATIQWFLSRQLRRDKFIGHPKETRPPWLLIILAAYVLGRLVVGQHFDLVAIRDAAPYLYSLVGMLAWASARWASKAAQERTRQLLVWSLSFHAAWFFVVFLVLPALPKSMPTLSAAQGIHIFTPRADIDTAIVGVLAAIFVGRLIRGALPHPWLISLAFIGCWVAILSTSSRAGLIGAVVANVYAVIAGLRAKDQFPTRKLVTIALLPLLAGVSLVVLPSTDIGTRLFATLGVSSESSDELALGAAGTARARSQAWEGLVGWTLDEPSRFLWGEGLGPNIMTMSGADILLVGNADEPETEPRSPHNYWAGSFARLGLFGLIPLALICASLILGAVRMSRRAGSSELRLILHVIPLSIIVPASLGVVLESPFGAIPFFWSIGVLLGLGGERRSAERLSNAAKAE
jgi:hypothetical protein